MGRRRPDLRGGDVPGHDLGVDVSLADPTCDQLGVLGPEVENQHHSFGDLSATLTAAPRASAVVAALAVVRLASEPHAHPIPTRWLRCSDLPSVWIEGAIMTSAFWNSLTSE